MMHNFLRVFGCCFILLMWSQSICTQNGNISDTTSTKTKLLGIAADSLSSYIDGGISYDTLIGNVRITQDSFYLYSDKAFIFKKLDIEATGNVVTLQGDSIEIFSDSLSYIDAKSETELFGKIVFKKGEKRLNTTKATYDIRNKKAFYTEGATLLNQSQRLISRRGVYEIDKDLAYFEGKVSVQDSASLLQTDSLKYNLTNETVYIIAPTNISSDSTVIYCEKGYFNYQTQIGEFYKNLQIKTGSKDILGRKVKYFKKRNEYILSGDPEILDKDSYAKADTIVFYENDDLVDLIGNAYYKDEDRELRSYRIKYNLETDEYETIGGSEVVDESGRKLKAELLYRDQENKDIAKNNVELYDAKEKVTLYSDVLISQNNSNNYITYNTDETQPLLIKDLDEDKLFLKSDTLSYMKLDSVEQYTGSGNISFLKGEMSGRSERLLYSILDSSYMFTDNPILWSDSIQITGDTIIVIIKDGSIQRLNVISNAFMAIQNEYGTYDQVLGEEMICHFKKDTIDYIDVIRNVEMVYFMYEDDELSGINHSFCGGLVFTFADGEIDYLRFKDKPNSKFNKGSISDPSSFNLQGFQWRADRKPNKISFQR